MTGPAKYDVLIIGGGLAGLTCALHLQQSDCKVLLIEKYKYPHHKVCGEYISNEVLPYLKSLGVDPLSCGAKRITNFEISSKNGNLLQTKLDLGGFGLSRYAFDAMLFDAIKEQVTVVFDTVDTITFQNDEFEVSTQNKDIFRAEFVVGAFGKRSNIDMNMERDFIKQGSPWLAVKAHYDYGFSDNTVALHNFEGGYCGLSKTETDAVNACYLTTYDSFKRFGSIQEFQDQVLSKNPYLNNFFRSAKPLFKKPLSISQISFEPKKPVENHICMIGDSAGLIHPLCGNGMAMAIHSAKIFSETFLKLYKNKNIKRRELEEQYEVEWEHTFSKRLKAGRKIQNILLRPMVTSIGFSAAKLFPGIVPNLIKKTHGKPLI